MLIRKTSEIVVAELGDKIKHARMSSAKSLTALCADAEMSVSNWYRVENEEVKALPLETLQKMESSLGVDFGIKFDC